MSKPAASSVDYIEAMDAVYDRLGGDDGLYEWAIASNENMREFYRLIAKRLPTVVAGDEEEPVRIVVQFPK
jgi:hypothetical protein